ncbi:MAG: 30S ribosomal protein S7 [Candidatus Abyssobacteria bacterium SURF_17]|jgi:small subunit ribosomal protein S7|uniref:Small ribosomal subunit protein uS7 n=1 Tax=Candidatus Abyssobacteria bacterium SURF_17 TaxID=2093361 RepID=A0A419EXJ8_9BACT|nr:MAG: 30S ribosomal protein S7 [Candidatus Abyssubacteria bacterium SURF_17]
MPRRKAAVKREPSPDPKYHSPLVSVFVNTLMLCGKKGLAEKIVYDALELAAKRLNVEVLDVFHKALNNVKPILEVKSRRVGGSTYQVPVEVRSERRTSLAMRWIIQHARQRGEKTMREKLAGEFMDAYKGEGTSVKKKEDTHRMAEANKAFAHYRW